MSDNIKVVVKVRPLISREIEEKLSYQWRVQNNTLYQLDQSGKDFGQCFTFDRVYGKDTKTSDVYDEIAKPIVEAATAGVNGTIFAYGQTSSGKTYTMSGTDTSPGIIHLAVINLFKIIKNIPDRDFLVRVSYVEIYNDIVKDLLTVDKKKVKIKETFNGVKVDAEEKVTATAEEVFEIMKEGEANRQVGATNMNEESSRSHSIFQITIESREHIEGEGEVGCVNVSQLNLVDLAGSERAGQTGATGVRFKEGTHINMSLSSLALVIKQLAEEPNKYINYRDSKLTRILQNSLGGNAKTSIICAITPAAIEETISTLQFANRAKAIKNKPKVNEVATNATMIQSLTAQLSKLQSQLESKKNLEQDNYNLTKQIAKLQRWILNGFGQAGAGAGAGRRKTWCAPRRATISTLHPSEEPTVPPPRFCTPVLKYNSMTTPGAPEFLTIHKDRMLPCVPEEVVDGQITPPPVRKVDFNNEIIELDSDDDDDTQVPEPCSPYHKCYGSSKTPPCILRKNAKQAEKNLQDIVELTEREKIYTPNVIELMEKLETNISVISKLEDEVLTLKNICKNKDSEMDELKNKVAMTENEVQKSMAAKLELETLCKDYNTKLTDLEVSYDTIKARAKRREDELLSLLNDQKVNNAPTDLKEKLLLRPLNKELSNFMDMSKDISLVKSDNECSIVSPNDDELSPKIQEIISDMQTQLSSKHQMILLFESKLSEQKEEIESLQERNRNFHNDVISLQTILETVENENSLLKSTIETLNATVQNQKDIIETSNTDIKSYNSLIHELQIKLTERDKKQNICIDDSLLEKMIANEEKFIANNENMENIVLSFRNAVDSRNKEIENLKTTVEKLSKNDIISDLESEIVIKKKLIDELNKEIEQLKYKHNHTIETVDKLMQDKTDLSSVEHQLTEKLGLCQEQNTKLQKLFQEKSVCIKNLEETIEKLTLDLTDKEVKVLEISSINEDLSKQISDLSQKINSLEDDIQLKENLILSLSKDEKETQECVTKAKTAYSQLRNILNILTGDIQEFPELIDNFLNVFHILLDTFNVLESSAIKVVSEKKLAEENNSVLIQKHNEQISELQIQIDNLKVIENERTVENENLIDQKLQLSNNLAKVSQELEIKNKYCIELETVINDLKENNGNLRNDLVSKLDVIQMLKNEVTAMHSDLQAFKELSCSKCVKYNEEVENLQSALKSEQDSFRLALQEKDKELTTIMIALQQAKVNLDDKIIELVNFKEVVNASVNNRDRLLENILKNICNLTSKYNLENNTVYEFTQGYEDTHEKIIVTLDKIAKYIEFIQSDHSVSDNSHDKEEMLCEAKEEVTKLTQQNLKLNDNLSELVSKNQELLYEIDKWQLCNKDLKNNLLESNKSLETLREEINIKENYLQTIEIKMKELEGQFQAMNSSSNQQVSGKLREKSSINTQCSEQDIQDKMEGKFLKSNYYSLENNAERLVSKLPINKNENGVPPSLLTICVNKIIDTLQVNVDDSSSAIHSNSELSLDSNKTKCQCKTLLSELQFSKNENVKLKSIMKELEAVNQHLLKEQEEIREEIHQLLEPANELQKKIQNHKTHLHTLTATTYTENKLLKSKVKVLQHYNNRIHNVSQKEIPVIKSQLQVLMAVLQQDPSIKVDKQNEGFKRYSLPDVLEKHSKNISVTNESVLDGDLLMLDTNVTIATSANTTLTGHEQTCMDLHQINLDNDVYDINDDALNLTLETLKQNYQELLEKLKHLPEEHNTLRDQVMNENTKLKEQIVEISDARNTIFNENIKLKEQIIEYADTKNAIINENLKLKEKIIEYSDAKNEIVSENLKLKDQITEYSKSKTPNSSKKDAQVSPMKLLTSPKKKLSITPKDYKFRNHSTTTHEKLEEEIAALSKKLSEVTAQNESIKKKYEDLKLEVPATDVLIKKITIFKKELNSKVAEIEKLTNTLNKKNVEFNQMREENDTLSTQIMENIMESDDLRKEVDALKDTNSELIQKCNKLEQLVNSGCPKCAFKDEPQLSSNCKENSEVRSKLNRSHSDSESSSTHNKISTLQNELHASREDCKILTQEVATIKNHLERSSVSMTMDLDESITSSDDHMDPCTKSLNMENIPEENPLDVYNLDKIECYNYYLEKTGATNKNDNFNGKIIDVIELLYNNLINKHNNEVENLVNKLRDFEEDRQKLQKSVDDALEMYKVICKEVETKNISLDSVSKTVSTLKDRTEELAGMVNNYDNANSIIMFRENLLKTLDMDFNLSTVKIFESIVNNITSKHNKDLTEINDKNTNLQEHIVKLNEQLNNVNQNLSEMKSQMTEREREYMLLIAKNEMIHQISNAVTLDIVRKEQELKETITKGYKNVIDLNILTPNDVNLNLSCKESLNLFFDSLVAKHNHPAIKKERENLISEVNSLKIILEQKDKALDMIKAENEKNQNENKSLELLKLEYDKMQNLKKEHETLVAENKKLRDLNNNIIHELTEKENNFQEQVLLYEKLQRNYEEKIAENNINIAKWSQDLNILKETIQDKQSMIVDLEKQLGNNKNSNNEEETYKPEYSETIRTLQKEIDELKSINSKVIEEKEKYVTELENANVTIKQKIKELDDMTADYLIIKVSVTDNVEEIERLKQEIQKILRKNIEYKVRADKLEKESGRTETTIKTLEKTVQLQTSLVMKARKERDDTIKEIETKMEELRKSYEDLQKECETLKDNYSKALEELEKAASMKEDLEASQEEVQKLKSIKQSLQTRISELELEAISKPRVSLDAMANSRRRRQSIYDSKRTLSEDKKDDEQKIDAVFASRASKPDDVFMDVDDDDHCSDRSTPIQLNRGRDSLSSQPRDQSDREEEPSSRPGSVAATRRRRQSSHDMRRSVTRLTPDPNTVSPSHHRDDLNKSQEEKSKDSKDASSESELSVRLAACSRELAELRERYREVDEECEICAQYLAERDRQCVRLTREKAELERHVEQLTEKLQLYGYPGKNKPGTCTYAHAGVNTDEDWTHLHAVVVDRMSYDAELERNRTLTKALDQFRAKNHDLKATVAELQAALELRAESDNNKIDVAEYEAKKKELHVCRKELHTCKEQLAALRNECTELQDLRNKCKQLDEIRNKCEKELDELRTRCKELDEECDICGEYLRERDEQICRLKQTNTALQAKVKEVADESSVCGLTSSRKKRQSVHDQNREQPPADRAYSPADRAHSPADRAHSPADRAHSPADRAHVAQLRKAMESLSQQKSALEQQLMSLSAPAAVPHPTLYVATGSGIVQNQQLSDIMKENQKLKKINAKLINVCKKRGKVSSDSNRENEDPSEII